MNILEKYNSAQLADIANKTKQDFVSDTGFVAPWISTAVSAGTLIAGTTEKKHPGVLILKSTTAANSGYRLQTTADSLLLQGGEKSTFVFRTMAQILDITRRMGFHDTTTSAAPTDGVYLRIVEGVLDGATAKGGNIVTTATTIQLSISTWYRGKIEINKDASIVTFTLYADDSDTVLWSNSITGNTPTDAGNYLRHGDICTIGASAAAINLGSLDYMDIALSNARKII